MKRIRPSLITLFCLLLSFMFTVTSGFAASNQIGRTGIKKTTSRTSIIRNQSATGMAISELPVLRVSAFRKYVDTTGMVMSSSVSGGASSRATSTSADLGEDIELYWSIGYKNTGVPRVSINGAVVTGEPHRASDGSYWVAGRKSFRPGNTTTYVLSATASPSKGGGRALQTRESLQVVVKKPVLTLLQPEVNQRNLKIKFFIKNTGNADFRATPINVNYQVGGGTIASGTFTKPRTAIRINQRVELGEITLPDRNRAFRTNSIRMRVTAGASYRMPLRETRADFTHDWTPSTFNINSAMLGLLSMGTNVEILVDNWNESHGSGFAISPPYQENASFAEIDILGRNERRVFTLPYLQLSSKRKALKYRIFVKNIRCNHRGDRDLFSVSNGKLKISLEFANPDTREIKIGRIGNLGRLAHKWIDNDAPDVNISRFTLDILLTPGARGNSITYTNVDVQLNGFSASFPGGWSWLNPGFQGYVTRVLKRNLDSALTGALNSSDTKAAVTEGLNQSIRNAGVDITRITNVRGAGSNITISYL